MKLTTIAAALALSGALSVLRAAAPADFTKDIKPILELSCLKCHGGEKPKGKFSLETRANALKGGNNGVAFVEMTCDTAPPSASHSHSRA